MTKITPCLWFDREGEEAARFYVSVFPNSSIGEISRYGEGMPLPAGTALTVAFTLDGKAFTTLNGGPMFKFTEAVSFQIGCKDQAEVDYYWEKLTADGGQESQCGWLKDRFGLSWQVVPDRLAELMTAGRPGPVGQALLQMKKIDIATLEKAAAG
jgi:predicted 3-demethylubiquinone-9 3-methyltransferase (glyoxalase superfamily)